MKTILIIISALINLEVTAQNHLIGVIGGANRTNITASNPFTQTDGKLSVLGGISYEYFLNQRVSIGADVIYSQRGFTDDFEIQAGEKLTTEYNYEYLSIPLKIGFYIRKKKKVVFTKVGLIPSLLIDAKTTTPIFQQDGTIIGTGTFNVKSIASKFDLAGLIEIGGGYKIVDRLWLTASFIYQHSLTSISNPEYFGDVDIRHNGMSLNVGLKWALQKE